MALLTTTDPLALRLLFSDELYWIDDEKPSVEPLNTAEEVQPILPAIEKEEVPQIIDFDYLGENNKYILLLVHEPPASHISTDNLEALKSILAAKKQELRDVAILNLANYPGTDYKQLKDFFACNNMVLFGINPKDIDLPDLPGNKITAVDTLKVLATYSFEEMQADTAKKRIFWNEMKSL